MMTLLLICALCAAVALRHVFVKKRMRGRRTKLGEHEFLAGCGIHDNAARQTIALATRKMIGRCTQLPPEQIHPDDGVSELFDLAGEYSGSAPMIADYLTSNTDFRFSDHELSMVANPDVRDVTVSEFANNLYEIVGKRAQS